YLDGAANNYLLAAHQAGSALGLALVDVSTGEFWVGEDAAGTGSLLEAALLRRPAELLMASDGDAALRQRLGGLGVPLTVGDHGWFKRENARERLHAHFRVADLERFGLGGMTAGVQAAGAALAYLRETQGDRLGHVSGLLRFTAGGALVLGPPRPTPPPPRALRDRAGAGRARIAHRPSRRHPHAHGRALSSAVAAPPAVRDATHRATAGCGSRARGRAGGGGGAADTGP